MGKVTNKIVQVHFSCSCGLNVVDHDSFLIKWRDLSSAGIVRKKDRSTGKTFLLMLEKSEICNCDNSF